MITDILSLTFAVIFVFFGITWTILAVGYVILKQYTVSNRTRQFVHDTVVVMWSMMVSASILYIIFEHVAPFVLSYLK